MSLSMDVEREEEEKVDAGAGDAAAAPVGTDSAFLALFQKPELPSAFSYWGLDALWALQASMLGGAALVSELSCNQIE